MKNEQKHEIMIINEEMIKDRVYPIRGEQVMLDFELAEIYGYETRYLNRQVKNNIEKFEGFIFQLNDAEKQTILKCKNFTSSWGGSRKAPYAFTEQGLYMLMTVLKGELATKQSRALIMCFKAMKDVFVGSNQLVTLNSLLELNNQVRENTKTIKVIDERLVKVENNFLDESNIKEIVVLKGKKYDAYQAYNSIYQSAKESIIIVDDYISNTTIDLLKGVKSNVIIHICSDNVNKLSQSIIEEISSEAKIRINMHKTKDLFHDRYIVIDDRVIYSSGPSSKDAGNKIGSIHEFMNEDVKKSLISLIHTLIR